MAYNNNIVDEIRDKCNIVDVIGRVVSLKKAGSNYKGLCPFHNEKTPSFVVSEQKQIFTCFGCGKSGNVIRFVQEYNNLDFLDACEKLAREYNIDFKRGGSYSKDNEKYYEMNREAAKFFYRAFRERKNPGYSYMRQRGISDETLKDFGIGYAENSWDSLLDHMKSLGYDDKDLLKIGLVSQRSGGSGKNRYYDKFRGRVMFPIRNTREKIIGFGGRIIGTGEPKYLNSPESQIFLKKNNLYGLDTARSGIGKAGYAILVEGYMDVISLYQSGVTNVLASLGTALTESQARMLKRYTPNVVLCYDADDAGRAAALRGIEILHKEGCNVKVLHVDDGKDPDEYIKKHGKASFLELVDKALPYADYKFADLRRRYDIEDRQGRIGYIKAAVNILKGLSPTEADMYIQEISSSTGISQQAIMTEMAAGRSDTASYSGGGRYSGRSGRPRSSSSGPDAGRPDRGRSGSSDRFGGPNSYGDEDPSDPQDVSMSGTEKTLIKLLLTDGKYLEILLSFEHAFKSSEGSDIFKAIVAQFHDTSGKNAGGSDDFQVDINQLADSLDEKTVEALYGIIENVRLGGREDDILYDCIQKVEIEDLEERVRELVDIIHMAEETDNNSEIESLIKKEMRLQKRIQALKERRPDQ